MKKRKETRQALQKCLGELLCWSFFLDMGTGEKRQAETIKDLYDHIKARTSARNSPHAKSKDNELGEICATHNTT